VKSIWQGPLVVKGIMSKEDAVAAPDFRQSFALSTMLPLLRLIAASSRF
jgi:hypothetical protein